jgi:hypothetical protein
MAGASAICVTQQGRELRKRTLPPDPGPIPSAPRTCAMACPVETWTALGERDIGVDHVTVYR